MKPGFWDLKCQCHNQFKIQRALTLAICSHSIFYIYTVYILFPLYFYISLCLYCMLIILESDWLSVCCAVCTRGKGHRTVGVDSWHVSVRYISKVSLCKSSSRYDWVELFWHPNKTAEWNHYTHEEMHLSWIEQITHINRKRVKSETNEGTFQHNVQTMTMYFHNLTCCPHVDSQLHESLLIFSK